MTRKLLLLSVLAGLLAGCALLRGNPLAANRGAVVLLFDTRTVPDLQRTRALLSDYGARATFLIAGNLRAGGAGAIENLTWDGHVIGLSGMRGADPRQQVEMFGFQKYYQDEIVMQVLDAQWYGYEAPYFAYPVGKRMPEADKFLQGKGFRKVVTTDTDAPRPTSRAEAEKPSLVSYALTDENFDPALIPQLAERNEILIVSPSMSVLSNVLETAVSARVPFATLDDL